MDGGGVVAVWVVEGGTGDVGPAVVGAFVCRGRGALVGPAGGDEVGSRSHGAAARFWLDPEPVVVAVAGARLVPEFGPGACALVVDPVPPVGDTEDVPVGDSEGASVGEDVLPCPEGGAVGAPDGEAVGPDVVPPVGAAV